MFSFTSENERELERRIQVEAAARNLILNKLDRLEKRIERLEVRTSSLPSNKTLGMGELKEDTNFAQF